MGGRLVGVPGGSPIPMSVPGIELKSPGLATSSFNH